MKNTKRKYIKVYLKRNIFLAALIALPISFMLFIVAIFANVLSYDILGSLAPVVIGAIFVAFYQLYTFRFLRMIRHQEDMYNIEFNDSNAQPLSKNSITFLSDEWLIHSGECAFYRGYIKSFSQKTYRSQFGPGYKVTVNTVDGKKYRFWTMASHDIDKYREWHSKQ